MMLIDIVVKLGLGVAKLGSIWNPKVKLWVDGRKDLFAKMESTIKPSDHVVWFHAASLGEFEEGRPVIEKVRVRYPEYKILLTFFSPSGYEVRKDYSLADWVFYLPADTTSNAKRFLDIVQPEIAIFIKYEFWPNLLAEMKHRSIRTFAISARFIPNSRFFSWYGGLFRSSLKAFEIIFVQDKTSLNLLASIGIHNAILAGDPRFDRVSEIASMDWGNEVVEKFKNGSNLFIAGSTCGAADEDLIQALINNHLDTKFLIVPHDMDVEPMQKIITNTCGGAVLYSQSTPETDFSTTQVLILDTIGMLAMVYRYGNWAYIGGGFIAGIHSVIEATVYGLPAVFGPNYQKNRPGIDMVAAGICTSITNAKELDTWFTPLEKDEQKLKAISERASNYTKENKGATEIILSNIFG